MVQAALPQKHAFADVLESVGTARANEQVTIASSVTERIERVLRDKDTLPERPADPEFDAHHDGTA